jgi:hypothetical protein
MGNRCSIIAIACITGCSGGSLQDAVKHQLSKSGAAQIRNVTYSDAGNYACVQVDQKDRQGALRHTDSYYQKINRNWTYVNAFDETHSECVQLINRLDVPPAPKKNGA